HLISSLSLFPPAPSSASYPLSLHDALPISVSPCGPYSCSSCLTRLTVICRSGCERFHPIHCGQPAAGDSFHPAAGHRRSARRKRSEEHTSELQSPYDLVCRLLLEKKKDRNS